MEDLRTIVYKACLENGQYKDVLNTDQISHEDKLKLAFSVMNQKQIVECAAQFAELVLPIFEAKYPKDDRPRKAIAAARSGDKDAARAAANAAAYAANAAAYAASAANASANAAADAAYAAYAAASAASAYAAAYAAYAASRSVMERRQLEIVENVLSEGRRDTGASQEVA